MFGNLRFGLATPIKVLAGVALALHLSACSHDEPSEDPDTGTSTYTRPSTPTTSPYSPSTSVPSTYPITSESNPLAEELEKKLGEVGCKFTVEYTRSRPWSVDWDKRTVSFHCGQSSDIKAQAERLFTSGVAVSVAELHLRKASVQSQLQLVRAFRDATANSSEDSIWTQKHRLAKKSVAQIEIGLEGLVESERDIYEHVVTFHKNLAASMAKLTELQEQLDTVSDKIDRLGVFLPKIKNGNPIDMEKDPRRYEERNKLQLDTALVSYQDLLEELVDEAMNSKEAAYLLLQHKQLGEVPTMEKGLLPLAEFLQAVSPNSTELVDAQIVERRYAMSEAAALRWNERNAIETWEFLYAKRELKRLGFFPMGVMVDNKPLIIINPWRLKTLPEGELEYLSRLVPLMARAAGRLAKEGPMPKGLETAKEVPHDSLESMAALYERLAKLDYSSKDRLLATLLETEKGPEQVRAVFFHPWTDKEATLRRAVAIMAEGYVELGWAKELGLDEEGLLKLCGESLKGELPPTHKNEAELKQQLREQIESRTLPSEQLEGFFQRANSVVERLHGPKLDGKPVEPMPAKSGPVTL